MKENKQSPPPLFRRFFRWFCDPHLVDSIEGDLLEVYQEAVREKGKRKADLRFMLEVLSLFRPGIIRGRRRKKFRLMTRWRGRCYADWAFPKNLSANLSLKTTRMASHTRSDSEKISATLFLLPLKNWSRRIDKGEKAAAATVLEEVRPKRD